jgi:hypothetical protein
MVATVHLHYSPKKFPPRLQNAVHFRYFVREQRSVVGQFEKLRFSGAQGAGEGAGRVAEQFALKQRPRQRGAIDRQNDERDIHRPLPCVCGLL